MVSLCEWINWELLLLMVFLFHGNHLQFAKLLSLHSCPRELTFSVGVVLIVVEIVEMLFSGVGV